MISRRDFIRATSAAAILSPTLLRGQSDSIGNLLPMRPFGGGKEMITAFTLGGAHVAKTDSPKTAEAVIEKAIELGCRSFDTAWKYSDGLSEEYYGRFLTPKYRDKVFIGTKSEATDVATAKAELADSQRRMKTDVIDLWQLHHLSSIENVQKRINNGVVDLFLKMRENGTARYIGFTGHVSYKAHAYLLDHCKKEGIHMDSCLMPLNLADPSLDSFLLNVQPKLAEQKTDLFAMKTMVGGRIFEHSDKLGPGTLTVKNLHEYVYSLPVCSLVSGCVRPEEVAENIDVLKNYQPMTAEKREALIAEASKISLPGMEFYKRKI